MTSHYHLGICFCYSSGKLWSQLICVGGDQVQVITSMAPTFPVAVITVPDPPPNAPYFWFHHVYTTTPGLPLTPSIHVEPGL